VSHGEYADRTDPTWTDRQTDGQTDGRYTVTLRFPLDAASVISNIKHFGTIPACHHENDYK